MREPAALAAEAAATWEREARAAVSTRGRFVVALSGGSTPSALYAALAGLRFDHLPWEATHVVWGDERCVPPDDGRSNYLMAARSGLLSRPLAGVHRMRGEDTPESAAAAYGVELAALAGPGSAAGSPPMAPPAPGPRALEPTPDPAPAPGPPAPASTPEWLPTLDLVLLGLGADGHTASLFPGSLVLGESGRAVAATEAHDGVRRLTLTFPVLRAARRVLFLVSGEDKRGAVRRVLRERDPGAPATQVAWRHGPVTWMMDAAAAPGIDGPGC